MKLSWKVFGGEVPRLEPHLLPESGAQFALNTKLYSGGLSPINMPALATDPPALLDGFDKHAIYRYEDTSVFNLSRWLWSVYLETDFTRGPTAKDAYNRIYVSTKGGGSGVMGIGEIAITPAETPLHLYPLVPIGVPEGGTSAPIVTLGGGTFGVPTQIVVAFANVDASGPVGALSASSAPTDFYPGNTMSLSGLPIIAAPAAGRLGVDSRNIYIAVTDSQGIASFRFWRNIPADVATYASGGSVDLSLLGEAPDDPSPLPAPNLFGLGVHPNGFMYGFDIEANQVCRSATFKPYSWPAEYRDPVRDPIVGGGVIGQSIVVCTTGKTILFTGQDPLNMSKIDLDGRQPCVAKQTIREVTGGLIYASADGLVLVTGNSALQVITAPFFTRDEWQALSPSTMHAAIHDDRVYLFTLTGCVILEMSGGAIRSVVRCSEIVDAAFSSLHDDTLYYSRSINNFLSVPGVQTIGGLIFAWDRGTTPMTQRWISRRVILDTRGLIGAARVLSLQSGQTVTFNFYSEDYAAPFTKTVTDDRPFVIPARRRIKSFYWKIETTSRITQVDVASSIGDFQSG